MINEDIKPKDFQFIPERNKESLRKFSKTKILKILTIYKFENGLTLFT